MIATGSFGVRLGNLIGLTWSQVDFQNRRLVFKTKSNRPGGDNFVLPLTQPIMLLRANQRGDHPEFVFTYICKKSRAGQREGRRYPFARTGWRKSWKAALDADGIKNFRFHDLRHTAATRTLRASNNLKFVQAMLGHPDIATTTRYAHAMTEDVRSAMEQAQSRGTPEPGQPRFATSLKEKGEHVATPLLPKQALYQAKLRPVARKLWGFALSCKVAKRTQKSVETAVADIRHYSF